MKIVSWNVNGIRSVMTKGALVSCIEALDPDVLCIQETKAHESQCDITSLGYHAVWNSAVKKGYSGTLILSKEAPLSVEQFTHDEKLFPMADSYGDLSLEGRVTVIETAKFYIVSVYTPNTKDDLSRLAIRTNSWDPAFRAYVEKLNRKKPVIICGDINVAHEAIDLANPKANEGKKGFTAEERSGFSALVSDGFIDSFRMFHSEGGVYSWWSPMMGARARNVGWRIDYILPHESIKGHVLEAHVHMDIMGSDHCPVSITLKQL